MAAIVHHGGIGTTAHALGAGIPQLIVPSVFDQPDNACRIEKLGVGLSVAPKQYTVEKAVTMLSQLLHSQEIKAALHRFKNKIDYTRSANAACEIIESQFV